MPSELKVNKLSPYTGSTLTLGDSGDTITLASGVSLTGVNATFSGDLTVDTDTLYVDSSNNSVGIGTTSPSTALDVDGTVTATQFVGGGLNAYRNIIINGDMSIAQRGTSATGLGNGDSGYHTVDRFQFFEGGSTTGEFTQSQSTDVPSGQGFGYSLKMDCTTADASLGASDEIQFRQKIEGQNLQYLKKGTSNAESLTLSFWVKSNKTGTYICELYDQDNTRQISKAYTIDSASTWEKKTLTFEGDTTGAFDNDNAASLQYTFWLGAGSNFTSGTLSDTWSSVTTANRAVGQVNLADSASNEWYITGVQLEVGTSASDFEFLPHDVNLQRCLRYYYKQADASSGTNQIVCVGFYESAAVIFGVIDFPVTMRTIPSNVSASGTNYYNIYANNSNDTFDSFSNALSSPKTAGFFSAQGSGTGGQAGSIRTNNSSAYVAFDAEL